MLKLIFLVTTLACGLFAVLLVDQRELELAALMAALAVVFTVLLVREFVGEKVQT